MPIDRPEIFVCCPQKSILDDAGADKIHCSEKLIRDGLNHGCDQFEENIPYIQLDKPSMLSFTRP